MRTIKWILVYVFTRPSRRSEQMRIDWHWFWKVDLPDWLDGISPFPSCTGNKKDNDDIPF